MSKLTILTAMKISAKHLSILCSGILVFCSEICLALDLDEMALPRGTYISNIGNDITHNGVPMMMRDLKSELPIGEVLAYYRNAWNLYAEDKAPGYIEKSIKGWQIISRFDGKDNLVVQVKSRKDGGTEGFISLVNLNDMVDRPDTQTHFPKLSNTSIISSTISRDDGNIAETIILKNKYSVYENARFYESEMAINGWETTISKSLQGIGLLVFKRDDKAAELTISKGDSGETIILINILTEKLT